MFGWLGAVTGTSATGPVRAIEASPSHRRAIPSQGPAGKSASHERQSTVSALTGRANRLVHPQAPFHMHDRSFILRPTGYNPPTGKAHRTAGLRAVIRRSSCRRPPSPVPATTVNQPYIYTSPHLR